MSDFRYVRPNNFPPIVKNLIIINVLVWVAQLLFDKEYNLTLKIGLWPIQSPVFKPYQIFTHMFAHDPGSPFHIIFNMFGLWMFGKILENVWGSKRFLFFYLACGIGAAAAQIIMTYIDGSFNFAIGASGAIMGIFIAFAYLFPNTPLYIMFIPIPVKAKWAMLGLVAIDIFGGVNPTYGGNVAHWAHLGGALTGFIIVFIWNKTNRKTLY